jgi:hypothetical protein
MDSEYERQNAINLNDTNGTSFSECMELLLPLHITVLQYYNSRSMGTARR